MHHFRANLLNGGEAKGPLLASKARKQGGGESLGSVAIPRSESRSANQRDDDRHRLVDETAEVRIGSRRATVELINLSRGGAMIETDLPCQLWDRVDLTLGEGGTIECAVRWVRDGRVGLEFAHETRIDCDPETQVAILREVLSRAFGQPTIDVPAPAPPPEPVAEPEPDGPQRRIAPRHPLIWNGAVHHDYETVAVRLRNISATGALVESQACFPVGVDLLLDLGEAGSIFATVGWARGNQAGLMFHEPYDLARLAQARPEAAPIDWIKPDYLADEGANSPWAAQWGRLSIDELHRSLAG